jgi:four helix bundle protein
MERKNINRGYKKLRVWNDAVDLYVITTSIFSRFSKDQMKVVSNSIDAAHSISRNIAEGYCRKSIKEYLNSLNYSLGSCGELHSCYYACFKANQITETDFEKIDELHFKVENQLLKLIESVQLKQKENSWEISFVKESAGK